MRGREIERERERGGERKKPKMCGVITAQKVARALSLSLSLSLPLFLPLSLLIERARREKRKVSHLSCLKNAKRFFLKGIKGIVRDPSDRQKGSRQKYKKHFFFFLPFFSNPPRLAFLASNRCNNQSHLKDHSREHSQEKSSSNFSALPCLFKL